MSKIGITGHQNFDGLTDVAWMKKALSDNISKIENIEFGYSSLAIGADTLFAESLLKMEIKLMPVIPSLNYESTFSPSDLIKFHFLLGRSDDRILLDFPHPSQEAFFAAGRHIADHSDVLFVLWDGKPAKGLGGTGDVFEYGLNNNTTMIHINPWFEKIYFYNKN